MTDPDDDADEEQHEGDDTGGGPVAVQHGKRKVPTAELVAELARGLEEHREECK